jgi:16S rRNA (adenine1518-N6/adenine1519-N6)-dimethyltransferase
MPLYRPSELAHFLESLNRGAKRTLSQNFLIDGNVVRQITDAVRVPLEGTIVEIGPGPGVLTEAFLDKGYSVVAIEKDGDFARELRRLDSSEKRLLTIHEDILNVSLQEYDLKKDLTAIVSNLPYHITTPILHWLCRQRMSFCSALFMMQQEVAEKLIKDRASYTQFELSLFFDIAPVCKVSKHCFTPSPQVDSEVISLTTKKSLDFPSEKIESVLLLVRSCFTHRRKTVVSTLSSQYDRKRLCEALEKMGISLNVRPEELHNDEWVVLLKEMME